MLRDDRGVTAIIVAVGMLLFLGMAALAIDIGLGFNERRQDQTSVDTGVMAGAVEALNGGASVRTQTLQYVRLNLPTIYTDGDWQALWEGCVDPAADRNAGGFNFVALDPPPGWAPVDSANWCLSMESARGLLRVRLPQQVIETTFGAVFGIDELKTSATAVSRIVFGGQGGILPFGIPFGSGAGGLLCLSSSPTGQAIDACSGGSSSGNFGTLQGRKFGNPDIPTSTNCNIQNPGQVLAQNIAHGFDHIVVPDPDGLVSNEVLDQCFNPFVDTLNTDTGFPNNGVERGLVGPMPVYTPRLAQSSNTTTVFGRPVDDTPLWFFLSAAPDYSVGGNAPVSCDPTSFDNNNPANPPFDWDGNGIDDASESWQHMQRCLNDYVGGSYSTVMFRSTLAGNQARFGYVPEFWESNLGNGNSWLHIYQFRAVYLQTTTWKAGNDFVFNSPGEPCVDGTGTTVSCSSGGYTMWQVTTFVIPDASLPPALRGSPPPGGTGLNPFTVELFD